MTTTTKQSPCVRGVDVPTDDLVAAVLSARAA